MVESDWTVLEEYATRYLADMDAATLEEAGVPVIIRGGETGIFGPGFAGGTQMGVRILVPKHRLERARELVGLPPAEAPAEE